MEKLIDLLNEYEDPMVSWYEEYVEEFWIFVLNNGEQGTAEEIIISKNYWFIKWLVENEKIDYKKLPYSYIYHDDEWSWEKELLMQLAIQDEPIEFLLKILK